MLWKGLFGEGIWSQVLKGKYLNRLLIIDWLKGQARKPTKRGFKVWKALMASFSTLFNWLAWKVGDEKHIVLSKDPFYRRCPCLQVIL